MSPHFLFFLSFYYYFSSSFWFFYKLGNILFKIFIYFFQPCNMARGILVS